MSKFARMTEVLDLFSADVTMLTAEDMAERLQVSRPTAFRYARELTEAGFLANFSGNYALGARIITLDFRIRASDPVLLAAREPMERLAAQSRHDVILCRMYNDEVINVHHERSGDAVSIGFGRGRPLPLFRGSASKAMLACMPTVRLRKLCERHATDPDLLDLGSAWSTWRSYFAGIRKAGHYVSEHEVDRGTVGIAAPVPLAGTAAPASISLVYTSDHVDPADVPSLTAQVMACARLITARLGPLASIKN